MGRELLPPGSLARKVSSTGHAPAENRIKRLQDTVVLVRTNLVQSFQKRHYDLRRCNWLPKIGDEVLKRMHILSKKAADINAILSEKFEGPCTVLRKISPIIFDLKGGDGKVIRQIHVKDIKPLQGQKLW